eukprot:gene11526-11670_t
MSVSWADKALGRREGAAAIYSALCSPLSLGAAATTALSAAPAAASPAGQMGQAVSSCQELWGCLPQPVILRGAAADWPIVEEPLGLSWLSQQQDFKGKVRVAPSLQFPFVQPQLLEVLLQLTGPAAAPSLEVEMSAAEFAERLQPRCSRPPVAFVPREYYYMQSDLPQSLKQYEGRIEQLLKAIIEIRGCKRMLFFSPDQLYRLYCYPDTHLLRRRSRVNIHAPDLRKFPLIDGLSALEVVLQPEAISLWGCEGEQWDQAGPLSDWSYAGFGAGEVAIPSNPVVVDVKRDFGAAGSGAADDSAAVQQALNATQATGGVIYFPPGKYILSEQLNISSNQVLRGAGRDLTTLYFDQSLTQINGWGNKWVPGRENSPYTWAGGLISSQRTKEIFPWQATQPVANVTAAASRGDNRLYIKGILDGQGKPADEIFVPGQWIALRLRENKQADLAKSLTNYKTEVGNRIAPMFANGVMLSHLSRVLAVGLDWLELERPLHVDVDLAFQPQIVRNVEAKVVGAGIEDLTIEFPWTPYLGHHEEAGWNGIEFVAAMNCWIRRVRIINADAGIKFYASIFNTISDIEILNTAPRHGGRQVEDKDGHIAVALHWACFDNLVEDIKVDGYYYHELLVAGYSAHNVFTRVKGTDICLDHHGAAPHNNLWTDIDVGIGQAAMRWSGDPEHYPFGGSNNVFWNIWASNISVPLDYVGRLAANRPDIRDQKRRATLYMIDRPARELGYAEVVVDMPLNQQMPSIRDAGDWLVHYNPDKRIWPANLHSAMTATRAHRLATSSKAVKITDVTAALITPRST